MSLLLLQLLNKESTLAKADIPITLGMQKHRLWKLLVCFEKLEVPESRLAVFSVFF